MNDSLEEIIATLNVYKIVQSSRKILYVFLSVQESNQICLSVLVATGSDLQPLWFYPCSEKLWMQKLKMKFLCWLVIRKPSHCSSKQNLLSVWSKFHVDSLFRSEDIETKWSAISMVIFAKSLKIINWTTNEIEMSNMHYSGSKNECFFCEHL